jgi:hypothetical protein
MSTAPKQLRLTVTNEETSEQFDMLSGPERTFRSGSRGYYVQGKATFGEKRYQVICNIVEIGSKPQSAPVNTGKKGSKN